MTTPIGHSLTGIAVFLTTAGSEQRKSFMLFALIMAAALAPDIDYFPILWGDLLSANAGHQGFTHSLIFSTSTALILAAAAALLKLGRYLPLLPFFIASAWSHLLLDLLTYDGREPVGIMLLWPWEQRFHSPLEIFGGFAKGSFADMVSWHNFTVVAGEIMILAPIAIGVWLLALKKRRGLQG